MINTIYTLITCIVVLTAITHTSLGVVSLKVTLADSNKLIAWADPNVPYIYPETMAGSEMTITLISDEGGHWLGGGIYIAMPFWANGELLGRDLNPMTQHYEGSVAENAGSDAWVTEGVTQVYGDWAIGYQFKGADDATPGPWFTIDFNTYNPGDCYIDLFDLSVTFDKPAISAYFPLVPTRDFNHDRVVSIPDFSAFGQQWGLELNDPNFFSEIDLVDDGHIDYLDLQAFSKFWLKRTHGNSKSLIISDANELPLE